MDPKHQVSNRKDYRYTVMNMNNVEWDYGSYQEWEDNSYQEWEEEEEEEWSPKSTVWWKEAPEWK